MPHYQGQCHCGKFRYTLNTAAITRALRCNCSYCRRRGSAMSEDYFPAAAFVAWEGEESLKRYRFGDVMVNHYFCPNCGIYVFHDVIENPGFRRINLGCIDGLDLDALEYRQVDGASF